MAANLSIGIDLALPPSSAFDALVDEIAIALEGTGLALTPGPQAPLTEGGAAIGKVTLWEPGRRIALSLAPTDWGGPKGAVIEILLEAIDGGGGGGGSGGTRVTVNCRDFAGLLGDGEELAGWFCGEVLAKVLAALAPGRLGNWITDRRARRPSGQMARKTYRDPLYHYPNFKAILAELALRQDDRLLDIGCGGGAFLKDALARGCGAAAGIDHSPDMVGVATQENQQAIADGRLVINRASADRLPFEDAQFTCASMTGVLGFLADPVGAFREVHRVLRPGGRLIALGSDPALRGTPAAPEPIASRLRFYDDEQLTQLARAAGFGDARVVRRELLEFAREVGVPAEHLPLFAGKAPFLIAQKADGGQCSPS